MAGALTISTLNNDTGVLATQNGMTGIAKAWVTWTGSSGAIVSSFNVSSMTQIATGRWRVTFTTAMPDANYSSIGYADLGTNGFCYKQGVNTTTTAEELRFIRTDSGNLFTPTTGYFVAFSA
jgi:hypothetical protein